MDGVLLGPQSKELRGLGGLHRTEPLLAKSARRGGRLGLEPLEFEGQGWDTVASVLTGICLCTVCRRRTGGWARGVSHYAAKGVLDLRVGDAAN